MKTTFIYCRRADRDKTALHVHIKWQDLDTTPTSMTVTWASVQSAEIIATTSMTLSHPESEMVLLGPLVTAPGEYIATVTFPSLPDSPSSTVRTKVREDFAV